MNILEGRREEEGEEGGRKEGRECSLEPPQESHSGPKCAGYRVNTQNWGSQGNGFPEWGEILGRVAGSAV